MFCCYSRQNTHRLEQDTLADISLARPEQGYEPEYSTEDGIKKIVVAATAIKSSKKKSNNNIITIEDTF